MCFRGKACHMDEQEKWEEIHKIQRSYFGEAYDYLKKTPKEQLEQLLHSRDYSSYILMLIGSFSYFDMKEIVDTFFEYIVSLSIDGSDSHIVWAKKIICSIDRFVLDEKLEEVVFNYLNSVKEKSDFYYICRSTASLLYYIRYDSLLSKFLEIYCMNSDDPDIKDTFDEFNEYLFRTG